MNFLIYVYCLKISIVCSISRLSLWERLRTKAYSYFNKRGSRLSPFVVRSASNMSEIVAPIMANVG